MTQIKKKYRTVEEKWGHGYLETGQGHHIQIPFEEARV